MAKNRGEMVPTQEKNNAALDQHIPKTRITNKRSPPWIDVDIVQMSKQKHSALKKSLRSNNTTDRDNYKAIRNRLKNLVASKYREFINNIAENLTTQPKNVGVYWHLEPRAEAPWDI